MSADNTILLLPIGEDDWSRMLYKASNGRMYVDVDGEPHTMTSEGEPIAPTSHQYRIVNQLEFNEATKKEQ